MSGLNKVMILGRLGADPEVKTVSGNQTVAKLSIATSETWTDKNGDKQEKTEWHRVILWGKLAELAGKYLSKGRQVYVEGKLQTRSWENDAGQKQYATEIVGSQMQFIGSAPGGNEQSAPRNAQRSSSGGGSKGSDFGPSDFGFNDEEVPF